MVLDDVIAVTEHLKNAFGDKKVSVYDTKGRSCTKDHAIETIVQGAKNTQKSGNLFIHYTGHGATNSGNWVLEDKDKPEEEIDLLTYTNILDTLVQAQFQGRGLYILADCCYGAYWLEELEKESNKAKYAKILQGNGLAKFLVMVLTTDNKKQEVDWQTQLEQVRENEEYIYDEKTAGNKVFYYEK